MATSTPVPPSRNAPCPCGSGLRFKACHGRAVANLADASPPSIEERMRVALDAHQRGDLDAAEALYREVLDQQREHLHARHFLGVILYQRGAFAAALPLLRATAAQHSLEPEFHNNLGLALAADGHEHEAIEAYRSAIALNPGRAVYWNNLGLAQQALNEVDAATASFRHALERAHDLPAAHWNLALALLVSGRFDEGWKEYEWRLSMPELHANAISFASAAWDGTSEVDTLLIHAEQGLGDAIQFIRYVETIAPRARMRIVHCKPDLAPLLATATGVSAVTIDTTPVPPHDAHVSLLSLPRFCSRIPDRVPYLDTGAPPLAPPSPRGAHVQRRRVGLAWAGRAAHANDRNRSMPVEVLAPLFDIDGIEWYSLQHGERQAEIFVHRFADRLRPLPEDSSLLDTARLIASLDLVVSVDSVAAHLAGALARPVWVLLPFAPDWRWLLERSDSPWYPTATLVRQPALRDWPSVVARVARTLAAGAPSILA